MSNDLGAFSVSLGRLAESLSDEGLKAAMDDLGVAAKGDLMDSARRDFGGDGAMSGWKRAPLKAGYEHTAPGTITVEGRPNGPWRVAEQGRSRGTKVKRGRRWGWGPTRPKYTFSDAQKVTEEETPERLEEAIDKLIRKIL